MNIRRMASLPAGTGISTVLLMAVGQYGTASDCDIGARSPDNISPPLPQGFTNRTSDA